MFSYVLGFKTFLSFIAFSLISSSKELDSLPYGRPEHLETKGAVQQRGGGLFQRRVICAGRFASDTAVVMTDKRFLQRKKNGAREVKKTFAPFCLTETNANLISLVKVRPAPHRRLRLLP